VTEKTILFQHFKSIMLTKDGAADGGGFINFIELTKNGMSTVPSIKNLQHV
jgi:hypothetical protein